MSETCQRGCTGIAVDERGRVAEHIERGRVGLPCPASRHASLEESARRRARRAAHLEAMAFDLEPAAAVALDAMLEGRDEFRSRRRDFVRVALRKLNAHDGTQWVRPYELSGPPGNGPWIGGRCRFCGARLDGPARRSRELQPRERAHVEQCALEYLAGLQRAKEPASTITHETEGDPACH